MNPRRKPFTPAISLLVETLESRVVLSAVAPSQGAAEVAAHTLNKSGTQTTLVTSAGTLGQPITFNVSVRAAASAGSPTGSVELIDQGQVLQTLTLSPTTSTSARYAVSGASLTLTQPPGGPSFYFGKHQVTAEFIPSGAFGKSVNTKAFFVTQPKYSALGGGVKVATITPGSGPAIQSGQTANVLYTGYLKQNGQIFDDSASHGGTPLAFTVGAGQVVPGFDAGTLGMQVGETRIISIPPAQGYGNVANGPIPANSTILFVVTLQSIT